MWARHPGTGHRNRVACQMWTPRGAVRDARFMLRSAKPEQPRPAMPEQLRPATPRRAEALILCPRSSPVLHLLAPRLNEDVTALRDRKVHHVPKGSAWTTPP